MSIPRPPPPALGTTRIRCGVWDNGSRGKGFQNVATGNCMNLIPGSPAAVNAIACDANDALQEWATKQYTRTVGTIVIHNLFTIANRGTAKPKCVNANGSGGDVNGLLCNGNNYQLW
jgi:hypothetical protein